MDHLRSLKTVPFESLGTVFYSRSILTKAVSCIVSVIKRDIGRTLHFSFDAPVSRVPAQYCHIVWCGKKPGVLLLPEGEKTFDMLSRLDTIPACDGRTDVFPQHSPHYA